MLKLQPDLGVEGFACSSFEHSELANNVGYRNFLAQLEIGLGEALFLGFRLHAAEDEAALREERLHIEFQSTTAVPLHVLAHLSLDRSGV